MFRIPNHSVLSSRGGDVRLTVVINGGRNSYFTFKDVLYEDVVLKKSCGIFSIPGNSGFLMPATNRLQNRLEVLEKSRIREWSDA